MKTKLILKPGQRGTKKLLNQYGDRLICVRYRYDEQSRKRFKTAEIIIDEKEWKPIPKTPPSEEKVFIQIKWNEKELQTLIKKSGGCWHPELELWEITYRKVKKLNLESRIITK